MLRHARPHLKPDSDELCVQPNAIDVRVDRIFRFTNATNDEFRLVDTPGTREVKNHRQTVEVLRQPIPRVDTPWAASGWVLGPGEYQFETTQSILVPAGMAGWLIPRSTLNRNGIGITSGLYDSGYNNGIGGLIRVPAGLTFTVSWRSRIAQFIMADAETAGLYAGDYNKKD